MSAACAASGASSTATASSSWRRPSKSANAQGAAVGALGGDARVGQARGPEVERVLGGDAPLDGVDHAVAGPAGRRAGELEEGQDRARRAALVAEVQVVDVGLVEVDRLLDQAQAEQRARRSRRCAARRAVIAVMWCRPSSAMASILLLGTRLRKLRKSLCVQQYQIIAQTTTRVAGRRDRC